MQVNISASAVINSGIFEQMSLKRSGKKKVKHRISPRERDCSKFGELHSHRHDRQKFLVWSLVKKSTRPQ